MKVLFISPSFYPATYYGGPIHINYAFCNSLAKTKCVQLSVLTTDANGPRSRVALNDFPATAGDAYEVFYCRRAFGPDISPGLLFRLFGMIRRADIVHLNGVYSFTTLPTLFLCRVLQKPVVWSPLGALQRWPGTTRGPAKRLWERTCNWLCAPDRVLLHVTSEEEKAESPSRISNASAVVIRNGIEAPSPGGRKSFRHGGGLRLLYLGRLHPIKAIENLLHAMTLVKTSTQLSICGEGENDYQERLQSLVSDLNLNDRVHFHGHVDGAAKEQQFLDADLCIVPSFLESFCTVVVESLARGVPVIASRGTPWKRIEEMNCGLWVANEPQDLARAIDEAARMSLGDMGLRGKEWMQTEYSWAGVVEEMIQQYQKLIETSELRRRRTARQTQAA